MEGSGKSACDLASRGESVIVETTENANQSPLQNPLNDTTLDIWAIVDRHSGSPTEPDSTPPFGGDDGAGSQSFEEQVKEAGPETQDPPRSPQPHITLVLAEEGRDEGGGDNPDQCSGKRKRSLADLDNGDDGGGASTCNGRYKRRNANRGDKARKGAEEDSGPAV